MAEQLAKILLRRRQVQERVNLSRSEIYRTAEHRALRAKLIRQWKPWGKSTGPKSAAGKVRVSRNAYKGGMRAILKEVRALLREME